MRETSKWAFADWWQWWAYLFRTKRLFPKIIFSDKHAGKYSPFGGPGAMIFINKDWSFKAKARMLIYGLGHWAIDLILAQHRPGIKLFNPKIKKHHLKWDLLWR